jgi:acetyl esterase
MMKLLAIKQDDGRAHNPQHNNFIDFLTVVIQKHSIHNGQAYNEFEGISFYCLIVSTHRTKGCGMKRLLLRITLSLITGILCTACCSVAPVVRLVIDCKNDKMQGVHVTLARVEDIRIPGPAGEIPLRIYTPREESPLPVFIWLHGGGWTFGKLNCFDALCAHIARTVGCVVVSVDYRLAPKHKFPAAVDDSYAAAAWIAQNAASINGDPARIAIGGGSAGGNLAAAVCLMARDKGGPTLIFQLLAYPSTNIATLETDSYRTYAKGYGLTRFHAKWFRKQYLKDEKDGSNPYASPLLAPDLSNLPPALILTGEYDVVRDDGEAYAKRLREAGVETRLIRYDGKGHMAYWTIAGDTAGVAVEHAVETLQKVFRP